jgi:hypothetical protein
MTPTTVQRIAELLEQERDDTWLQNVHAVREEIEADRRHFEEMLQKLDEAEYNLDEAQYEFEYEADEKEGE